MSTATELQSHGDSVSAKNKKLLPALIDEIAKNDPSTVFCEIPVSASTYSQGYRQIVYKQFATAVNGAAWWLRDTLGEGRDFETLTYIGPNDLRYLFLILGAMLLTSPRNTVAAHENLMKLLRCDKLITPTLKAPPVTAIMALCQVRLIECPSLEYFLDEYHPDYPYEKSYEVAKDEPFVVLHTSGSTGLPKPLVLPHAFARAFANTTQAETPHGYTSQSHLLHGRRMVTTLPLFHAVGIYFGLISAVFNHTVVVWPLSGAIPTAGGLVEALSVTQAESMLLAPSIVEDISKDQAFLDRLASSVKAIAYTGGDLSQQSGDIVASRVLLFPIYGSTEKGHGPQIFPSQAQSHTDWKYIAYNDSIWGAEFCHHTKFLYELRVKQSPTSLCYQPAFTLFPRTDEYCTRDLFSPHPTIPGLWAYGGRSDDIIVFLNGEKTNPTSTEGHVASHPDVRSAMVLGERRFEAALLIEPTAERAMSVKDRAELLERVWPTIDAANAECPAYAKISKSHVMFTSPEKPVVRAGKGTVMRRATRELYAKELDQLYSNAKELATQGRLSNSEREALISEEAKMSDYIRQLVLTVTDWNGLADGDDFFSLGMDSLQTLQLARKMQQICKLGPSTIYTNSTVTRLAEATIRSVLDHEASSSSDVKVRFDEMQSLLTMYQKAIDEIKVQNLMASNDGSTESTSHIILLTGSTGTLGSYILESLLGDAAIKHIYCFNRSLDSGVLQASRNRARQLTTTFPDHRVTFLTGDLAANETLSLDEKVYAKLRSEVTYIIHNAWTVDFNLALPSFTAHLAGIVNLARLNACGTRSPRIMFVSSISSVQSWSTTATVPERIVTELSAPAANGYGRSKYLAERLLQHASESLNIKVDIARIGQITGPLRSAGVWNRTEWFPSLIITSQNLGVLPEFLGNAESSFEDIDWTAIDAVADILVELTLGEHPSHAQTKDNLCVWHLINPQTTLWSKLRSSIIAALLSIEPAERTGSSTPDVVPYLTWLDLLRSKAGTTTHSDAEMEALVARYPALKLMGFFEALASGEMVYPTLETAETQRASARMRALEPVDEGAVERWVARWFG